MRCNKISKIHEEFNNNKKVISEFYDLFINDYYVSFINENLGNYVIIEETKSFFNEKVDKNDENISNDDENLKCAKKINFIECYKYQFTLLLKTYFLTKKHNLFSMDFKINKILVRSNDSNEIINFIQSYVKRIFIEFTKIKEFNI